MYGHAQVLVSDRDLTMSDTQKLLSYKYAAA
jgi:hypothetical protein